jgi:cold shock CspA family protein
MSWPLIDSQMGDEYFDGAMRSGTPKRSGKPSRNDPRGKPATGRIAMILVGQGHGSFRPRDEREIFLHRGDLREGTAFKDLQIGDIVTFELLEDSVNGEHALRVNRPTGVGE